MLHRVSLLSAMLAMPLWLASLSDAPKSQQGISQVKSNWTADKIACLVCHEDQGAFRTSPHGRAMEFGNPKFGEKNCQSCHGDGKEHSESGDVAKIVNPGKVKAAQANETCLTCHSRDQAHAFWRGSAHENAGVSCLTCHSVHHAKQERRLLARRTEAETCYTCHANVRKANLQRATHLFRDASGTARIGCSGCHNVHGTQTEKLISANSVNEKCFACHAEKRGPFLWEHAPARENCLTCHTPHGSNNRGLLVMRTTQLCQSCHIQGRHQTVAGRPNTIFNFNRACLNCHAMVHGTNHPSGVILQR